VSYTRKSYKALLFSLIHVKEKVSVNKGVIFENIYYIIVL